MSKPRNLGDHPNTRGTAATEDVTTSQEDSTQGRVLRVGDFGLGLQALTQNQPLIDSHADLDLRRGTGFYPVSIATAPSMYGLLLHLDRFDDGAGTVRVAQFFYAIGSASSTQYTQVRYLVDTTWSDWYVVADSIPVNMSGDTLEDKKGNRFIGWGSSSGPPTDDIPAIGGHSGISLFASPTRGAQLLIRNQSASTGGNRMYIRGYDEADGFWSDWSQVYNSQSIIGTVAQSGGVPTIGSAIIEKGYNSNGRYVKFADGTMICTVQINGIDTTDSVGNIWRATSGTVWSFPASFSEDPRVSANAQSSFRWCSTNGAGPTNVTLYAMSAVSHSGVSVDVIAIGRWV